MNMVMRVWPVPCSIRSAVISTKMPMEPMQTMERYWAPYSAMMGETPFCMEK